MIPDWVKDAVFYQIFPDRFYNGDLLNDPENIKSWNSEPTIRGFQGGDLSGIIIKFDYFLDLGINALYLNPIFLSSSTHRYDTIDYFQIDKKLGDLDTFHQLIDIAHKNGVKIILDGVFNHTARGFFAFNDILENGEDSPYRNWYYITHYPVDAYSAGKAKDFAAWWGFKSLPKLNTAHKPVRDYLLSVARYWIEQGADGWRLDVPNEIEDDSFWNQFRNDVKSINPNTYLVGEIWEPSAKWVDENHFDGIMNYPLRDYLLKFLTGKNNAEILNLKILDLLKLYSGEKIFGMFNLLGSHDTERIFTLLNNDSQLVKLAYLILLTLPGVPVIYYGDEVAVSGGKDPECRKTFQWDSQTQNLEIFHWIKKLIQYRKVFPTLSTGEFFQISNSNKTDIFTYARVSYGQQFIIVINRSSRFISFDLDISPLIISNHLVINNLLGEESFSIDPKQSILNLSLPSKTGYLLLVK